MIRTIRIALAQRAFIRAHAARAAYDGQPPGAGWHVCVAVALLRRENHAAARLARAHCH